MNVRRGVVLGLLAVGLVVLVHPKAQANARARLIDLATGEPTTNPFAVAREETLVLPAALALSPGLPAPERESLGLHLREAYEVMEREMGVVPSPFRPTTGPGPALEIAPLGRATLPPPAERSGAPGDVAVVFLHGGGGSFALQCWLVARAADAVGARTICPSIGIEGDWWTAAGEREARRAIELARERGARRVVLAGLSNGGIGVSRLAPRLGRAIDGLVLLSGVSRGAAPTRAPTLVLHGRRDQMTSFGAAAAYAARAPRARLEALDGTHFVLIEEREAARERLAAWLRRWASPGATTTP